MKASKIYYPKDCENYPFFRRYKFKGRTNIDCTHYPNELFPRVFNSKPEFCSVERIEVYEKEE